MLELLITDDWLLPHSSLRRSKPTMPITPEPISMKLLGSGVVPPLPPLMVKSSEGIVPERVLGR